jgi:hypothetical protein
MWSCLRLTAAPSLLRHVGAHMVRRSDDPVLTQRKGDIHEDQTPRNALRAGRRRYRCLRRRSTARAEHRYCARLLRCRSKCPRCGQIQERLCLPGRRDARALWGSLSLSGRAVEGPPPASGVSILEFPSMDKAEAWSNSPEYDKIKPVRHAVATTRSFIIEGRAPGQ